MFTSIICRVIGGMIANAIYEIIAVSCVADANRRSSGANTREYRIPARSARRTITLVRRVFYQ